MSCDKVQNPSGFAPCRVAKSKTRRVSRYVVWQSLKLAGFLVHPCRGVLHTPPNVLRQGFGSKIGQDLGVSGYGNVKPAKFFMYPCRVQKHTPRNVLRRWFRCKTGWVLGVSGYGNVKPAKFFTYSCRGILHTPRNVLRRRFGSKIGQVLGASLLERVKSGAFLAYPDGEMWNPPGFWCTRVGAYCIRPEKILAEGLRLKPDGVWAYPYWEMENRVRF